MKDKPMMTRKRAALAEINSNQIAASQDNPAKRAKLQSTIQKFAPLTQPNASVPKELAVTHVEPSAQVTESPLAEPEVPIEVDEDDKTTPAGLGSLPEEMLEKIFKNLDRGSQLNLAAASSRMNDCFSTTSILKDFKLTVDFDTIYFPNFNRAYSNVIFKNLTVPSTAGREMSLKNVIKKMGPNIKKLQIVHSSLSENFLSKVLRYCRNIESLTFKKVTLRSSMYCYQLNFPQLKKLSIDSETNSEYLGHILATVSSLEAVTCSVNRERTDDDASDDSFDEAVEDPRRSFVVADILMRQPNLKKLNISSAGIFESILNPCPFQLDTLVLFISSMTQTQTRNMKKFVKSQHQLEYVTLNVQTNFYSPSLLKTFDHILGMPALKTLNIVFYTATKMAEFYLNSGKVNTSVERLYLSIHSLDHSHRRFVETTSKMFPNLKCLHLNVSGGWTRNDSNSSKTFISLNNLRSLQKLGLENFGTSLMTQLSFQQLKHISLITLQQFDKNELRAFMVGNRSLDTCHVTFGSTILDNQSAIGFIESTVMNAPTVNTIVMCSQGQELTQDSLDQIKLYIKRSSSSLQMLKVCSEVHTF